MASIPTQELQKEFLTTVRKGQETMLEAIGTWADIVQSVVPKIPAVHTPLTSRLPKPEELITNAYDFAEQLLASQRTFAVEALKAASPLFPGADEAPKAPGAKAAN